MYLKSIEVLGFKSFANRIVFDFHNGITGIVGPNGSGKSNVADAVRWVLGEQRIKQLRGGTMQDVIFAGTQSRRPQSYASVAITLDNSDRQLAVDFQEVTVTRKLYRSGESEYMINGSPCRLKDINELFYDTGIGKEGYSIIGQGQIDRILSGKPEERRELFDEAAGIVKFKKRKSQSIKKLEEEESNLTRVTDILNELRRQVGPLEKQSRTAREYLAKKEELKRYDINLFLSENTRLKRREEELSHLLDDAKAQQEEAQISYGQMKEAYEQIEEELSVLESETDRAKRQQSETHLLRQQLEGRIELLGEQINTIKAGDAHFSSRVEELEERTRGQKEQEEAFVSERQSLQEQLDETAAALEKSAGEYEEGMRRQDEIRRMLADCREKLVAMERNRAVDDARLSGFDKEKEQLDRRITEAKAAVDTLTKNQSSFGADQDTLEAELADVQQQIEVCDKKRAEASDGIKAQKELVDTLTASRQTLWQELHRNESRLETVRNMAMRYEGYGNSIKKVMEQKDRVSGLYGVVADLIRTKKEYETAIETALGGAIQNIVTKDEGIAKQMIEYLKRNRLGRATFLPLSVMAGKKRQADPNILSFPGVIGVASDLVETQDMFAGLREHLLGRTYVTRTIDDGIALSRKYRQTLRIVTLEGELLNPGGAMTGGSYRNAGNLLGRQREIDALADTIKEQKKQLANKEEQLAGCKQERSRLFAELDQAKEERSALQIREQRIRIMLHEANEKKEQLVVELAEAKQQSVRLQEAMDALIRQQQELGERARTALDDTKELKARETFLEQSMASGKEKLATVEKSRGALQIKEASLLQKIENIESNIETIKAELIRIADAKKELFDGRQETAGQIKEKEDEIGRLKKSIEDANSLVAEIRQEIDELQKKREESSRRHRSFLDKREELTRHMAALDKEAYRLADQLEQTRSRSAQLTDYMWNEYELTYNRALELQDETLTDLTKMKQRIKELKNEIRSLGPVNVNAIEEYREVNERYTFLQGQYDDLVEAKKTLEGIIESLDQSMRARFTEQFARISTEFNAVFRQLFGGGQGTLELMEDMDVLEAGIRIIAQPPGKKLQNMMQLSGGEKALTAISLLFAIQNLKPSPFCLLDEIEAALDDNNVNRFARYLHKLTKHTQFIVITHRRGTMTAADRLYGITMQEKGVSTLVSVDLIEDELAKQEQAKE